MRKHTIQLSRAILFTLIFLTLLPMAAFSATKRIVDKNTSHTCDPNPADPDTTPPCYRSINDALDASVDNDTIELKSDTYTETITLDKSITIQGTETAKTYLSGGGSSPIISVTGGASPSIANLTFQSAAIGIDVSGTSSATITNNIFQGLSNKAIQMFTTSAAPLVKNNVFYNNNFAISANVAFLIVNNIFMGNDTAIDSTDASTTYIKYNCFSGNTLNGKTGDTTTNVTTDPKFVDISAGDFHLQQGSPCIDTGDNQLAYNDPTISSNYYPNSRNDMGAYGGPNTDKIPLMVSKPTASPGSTNDSVSLSWSQNKCYLVAGYKVYYSLGKPGAPYESSLDAGNVTSTPISGLTTTVQTPDAPTLEQPSPRDGKLILNWSDVNGATGYKVHYRLVSGSTDTITIDVGDVTTYILTGLTNGQDYDIAVSAYAQPIYYFSVTAYYSSATSGYESEYSLEESEKIGNPQDSLISNVVTDYPEPLEAVPNLPDKGCFIATAAYGYYSAPQVQALREFRDRYLLTNGPGRAFVQWYYRHSPAAARFINDHSWLKPVVRGALMPAVAGAMFMTETSVLTKIFIVISIGLLVIILLRKNRPDKSSL